MDTTQRVSNPTAYQPVPNSLLLADDDDFEIPDLPKKEEPKSGGLDEEEDEEENDGSKGVPKV